MSLEPHFLQNALPELQAGGFDKVDGTVQFYSRVNALIEPSFVVLDFGAGRGEPHIDDTIAYRRKLRLLRGKVAEVIGADVDPIVQTNPGIDRAVVLSNQKIALPDESIDLIVSDFTFEHLPDPVATVSELDRVLRPGGWLCARTPNRNGYIAVINRLLSDRLKERILYGAQPERKEEDVFPAFYRLNTLKAIREHFPLSRYENASYAWDASPAYHFNRPVVFRLLKAIHSVSPSHLKTTLMIFLRKRP